MNKHSNRYQKLLATLWLLAGRLPGNKSVEFVNYSNVYINIR